jgi:hypothetical protein
MYEIQTQVSWTTGIFYDHFCTVAHQIRWSLEGLTTGRPNGRGPWRISHDFPDKKWGHGATPTASPRKSGAVQVCAKLPWQKVGPCKFVRSFPGKKWGRASLCKASPTKSEAVQTCAKLRQQKVRSCTFMQSSTGKKWGRFRNCIRWIRRRANCFRNCLSWIRRLSFRLFFIALARLQSSVNRPILSFR